MATVLMAPIVLIVVSTQMRPDREPFWRWSSADPTYAYLLNGLSLATGSPPWLVDHPGTPVQLIVAAAIRVRHALATSPASQDLVDDVLRDPESYCRFASVIMVAFYALVLCVTGLLAMEVTNSAFLAVVIQVAPLLSRTVWDGLFKVGPESLLVACGAFATACALSLARSDSPGRHAVIAAGVAAGLGIATKITFIPVALLLGLLVRTRGRFVFATAAFTAFGVAILPAAPRLPTFLAFCLQIATHEDLYRGGPAGAPPASQWAVNCWRLYVGDPLLCVVGALCVMALASRWGRGADPRTRHGLVVATVAMVIQIALAAKDPMAATRYLVPMLGASGLHVALLLNAAHQAAARRSAASCPVLGSRYLLVTIVALALAGARSGRSLYYQQRQSAVERLGMQSLSDHSDAATGCQTVQYRGSSTLPFALYFGDTWSGQQFSPRLKLLYPTAFTYDVERNAFFHFDRELDPAAFTGRHECVLLRGYTQEGETRANAPLPPPFRLSLVRREGREALYALE